MSAPPTHFGQNASTFASGWPLPALGPGPQQHASPVPSSPFTLEVGREEDVALFQDARTGFSHLLPGRPSLGAPRPGDPPADVTVHLQDAPITIRYRLEAPAVHAPSTAELARLTAERFASWRARRAVRAEFANPTWLGAWGCEAAAVATYEVATPAGPGQEDLFVLVRHGALYVVTWTYPQGFTADPAYAGFASVAEATMIWDPMRWEQRGRVWPESSFVGPGIHARPKPHHHEGVHWLGRLPLPDDERGRILGVLATVISDAGAPWVELRHDVLDQHARAITSAIRTPELYTFLRNVFSEVRTAHDLRGLAILLGRALERRASSRPPARGG